MAIAEQSRLLSQALQKVTDSAYQMQRSIENNDPVTTLENACAFLEELGDPNHGLHHKRGGPGPAAGGTPYGPPPSYYSSGGAVPPLGNYGDRPYNSYGHHGNFGSGGGGGQGGYITPLSPKNYYELHMRAMDEMPVLEEFLVGLCHFATPGGGAATNVGGPTNYAQQHQQQLAPYTTQVLYETVQYCPRVVPRLYLQICMGAVSIRAGSTPAVQVMEELAEASKCVQCPVRGLFLRYYLLMALKDKLPDGSLDEGEEDKKEEAGKENAQIASPLTPVHVEAEEDLLGMGATISEPTSPPPALPPPPPPSTAGPLFPESTEATDTPLFSDSPLGEEHGTTIPSHPEKAADCTAASTEDAAGNTANGGSNEPSRVAPVVDSYNFILNNLLEMNRLWIRIQHMPGDKTKETKRRRERERNDLRILVGSNLNRLSSLEGITAHEYGIKILPRILGEITSCRDPLSQAYLMDCIIQVFPDEFHLETLEIFLGVCPRLREKVNVRTIMNNMMERLLNYYQEDKIGEHDDEDTNDVKTMMARQSFDMFEDCVHSVFEARGLGIPPRDIVRLQGCLLDYALKIAPGDTELITRCISQCAKALGVLQEQKRASMMGQGIVVGGGTKKSLEIDMDDVATTALEKLLSVPLDSMGLKVLDMPDFALLLAFLPWENRKKVALGLVKSLVGGGGEKRVKDVNELEQLFTIVAPLLRDEGMAAPVMPDSGGHQAPEGSLISRTANLMGTLGISSHPDELFGGPNSLGSIHGAQSFGGDPQFREEQSLVAKLVHVLDNEDTDVVYQMLNVSRRHIQPGGAARIKITFPAIVFSALELLRRVQQLEFPDPKPVPPKTESSPKEKKEEQPKGEGTVEEATDEAKVSVEEANEEPKKESDDGDQTAVKTAAEGGSAEGYIGEIKTNSADVEDKSPTEEKSSAEDEPKQEEGEKESAADGKPKEETSSPATAEDEPTQLFPEFTKSVNCRKILVFLQKSVAMLAPNNPELAFKLYLEIAVSTDLLAHTTQQLNFPTASGEFCSIAYDFMTQAFMVYEDEISESSAQIRAITTIVGSLLLCKTFERTDYEALITKTAQYAAKLLKKPDQCRMVCLCSRLFYVVGSGKDVSRSAAPSPGFVQY